MCPLFLEAQPLAPGGERTKKSRTAAWRGVTFSAAAASTFLRQGPHHVCTWRAKSEQKRSKTRILVIGYDFAFCIIDSVKHGINSTRRLSMLTGPTHSSAMSSRRSAGNRTNLQLADAFLECGNLGRVHLLLRRTQLHGSHTLREQQGASRLLQLFQAGIRREMGVTHTRTEHSSGRASTGQP